MSDLQSNSTEVSSENEDTLNSSENNEEKSQSSSRRRRRVEAPIDIDNDRVFTNEDILSDAKDEVGIENPKLGPDSRAQLRREGMEAAPFKEGATRRRRIKVQDDDEVQEEPKNNTDSKDIDSEIEKTKKSRTRKRTVAKADEAVKESKPLVKPTIGSTISADVVAKMQSSAETSNTRKRTRKQSRDESGPDKGSKSKLKRGKKANAKDSKSKSADPIVADLGIDEDFEIDKKTLKKRIKKLGAGKATGRYSMYVHVDKRGNTQLAITEGRILTEHYVSRADLDESIAIDGNIYSGKVQNVLPGMEAAFIDIDTPKNAVLYRADVMYDHDKYKRQPPRIEESLSNGQMTLVQVTKNPIAHKGARLTQEVSLAGRFVVLIPNQPTTYGISKRLPDDERRRLRRILDEIRPQDAGLIVRTAAEGATDDELRRDMTRLSDQWEQIKEIASKSEKSRKATLVYKEPPLVMRMIREEFNKEFRTIVIDDKKLYEEIKHYVDSITPELSDRVEYYDPNDELNVYERYHVTEQLTKALENKVWLPSGGSLIIERTEALTVIDVNTGKNVGTSNLEETVYENNLEAADEIARQLRLRDIGGIIVIDFVDMEIEKNRFTLTDRLRDALARDKTRTQVFEVTELGLVQMTRKRLSEGMVESFADSCPTCEGRGFVIDEDMVGGFAPIAIEEKAILDKK
ncbi:MAG TPA: Rne/Rng family ribonuclease [Acidimicrobiia bacterium]|nr:Rne/Rng family ribonuclease [Acidimicrobiia bacterium]